MIGCGLTASATAQNVPPLSHVSTLIAQKSRVALLRERERLSIEFKNLKKEADINSYHCANYAPRSDRADQCASLENSFAKKAGIYIKKAKAFNKKVRNANRNVASARLLLSGKGILIVPRRVTGRVKYYYKNQRVKKKSGPIRVDKIVTGSGDHVTLRFDDDHVLSIGPNTTLALDQSAYDKTLSISERVTKRVIDLKRGVIRFSTSLSSRIPHLRRVDPFTIRTPKAVTSDRGTDFEIRSEKNGKFSWEVFEGSIEIILIETGELRVVKAGEKVVLSQ